MSDRPTSPGLQAEMTEVSAIFDADFYAATYPDVADENADLLKHFCLEGWKMLLKPNPDFDVWWYWANHLDPASEEINPALHYVRTGRPLGLTTKPSPAPARAGSALPADRPARRACLFAGFDAEGIVDESVLIYLRELSRFADVFCLFDNYLPRSELDKLTVVTSGAWAVRHGAYDIGSYSLLAGQLVGWERLSSYDEVLLVNDSCYLLRPLDDVFAQMDAEVCDWWGMQATKGIASTREIPSNHFSEPIPLDTVRDELLATFEADDVYDFLLGSYFLAFRRPVLDDPVFRRVVESVGPQSSKLTIIQKYEVGLTHLLIGRGYAFSTFVPALYPFHPVFTEWALELIARGFPLLKKYLLYQNHYDAPGLRGWKERIADLVPNAPVEVFEENLVRTAPADRLRRSFSIERADDGTVLVPKIPSAKAFAKRERTEPKHPDRWLFAVDPDTGRLPANARAIFDQVADDPELTKIILTRSRRLEPVGRNVICEPLLSPEGRAHLIGAGVIFLADAVSRGLRTGVQPKEHPVIAVRGGLALLRHGRTASSPKHPGTDPPPPATGPLQTLHRTPKIVRTAILTASDLDQLAEISSNWPNRYADAWRTGLPIHDYLVAPALPSDLEAQQERLRAELAGRRLLLLNAARRHSSSARTAYPFTATEVAAVAACAAEAGAVIGIREPITDLGRPYATAFGELALDLSPHRFPSTEVVLRAADALVTDYDGSALDFLVTGRPVLSFAHDLEAAAGELLYDLEHMFPGQVTQDFDALLAALPGLLDPGAPQTRQYARAREMLIDHREQRSAALIVERVRALLEELPR